MRVVTRVLLAIGFVALSLSQAQAGLFLTGFTGNTPFNGAAIADGTVSFSVYQNDPGDNWATDLGVDPQGTSIDETAPYVYFYQVVNDNPLTPDDPLAAFLTPKNGSEYSSMGYLDEMVFDDGGTGVNGTTNTGLDDGRDLNAQSSAFIPDDNAMNPSSISAAPTDFVRFNFVPEIPTGAYSTILFVTSNLGPIYATGQLRDGATATGSIASHGAPEPGSLLVWGGLLVVGATVTACRRRSRKIA